MNYKKITLEDVKQHATGNVGFDALRVKHAILSLDNGMDMQACLQRYYNNEVIKKLIANKQVKHAWIGCNLYVFYNDTSMQSENIHTAYITRKSTLTEVLNNILKASFSVNGITHHNGSWSINEVIARRLAIAPNQVAVNNLLRQISKVYKRAFIIGLDIFPNELFGMFNNQYNKQLTTKEKKNKYNK